MSKPMLLADFVRLPPLIRSDVVEGLAAAIDIVAERGPPSHRFLRFGWYAAALAAYGGAARTLVVEEDGVAVLTLPFVALGRFRIAGIPGHRWPFRSVGLAFGASDAALRAALSVLAWQVSGLRLSPVRDDDPVASALIAAARAQGWIALGRPIRRRASTAAGDRVFWQAALADPVLAQMIRMSGPTIEGAPRIEIDTGDGVYSVSDDAAGWSALSFGNAPTCDWLLLRPGLPAIAGRLFGWFWQRSRRQRP